MPTVIINLPESITTKIRGREMTVDFTKYTDLTEFATKALDYGIGRWYNDKAAQGLGPKPKREAFATDKEFEVAVNKFADDCLANAIAVRNDNYAGTYTKERGASESKLDPVTKHARAIAAERVATQLGRIVKEKWIVTPEQMTTARAVAAKAELDLSDAKAFLDEVKRRTALKPDVIEEATRRAKKDAESVADVSALVDSLV